MDVMERLRQLAELMNRYDLGELEVEEPEARIRIKKNQPIQYIPPGFNAVQFQQSPVAGGALQGPQGAAGQALPAERGEKLLEITSPMVGTFYRASGPGADSYVSVGSTVDADTVVCIVEAMKVMNEIKAGVSGEIVEILVEDAEPVEFGQILFLVRPEGER